MNTARPCKQLHKTTPQAIHRNCKKFYWCPVAPIFSPAGEKIEQVSLEQEIRRANKAGTKKSLSRPRKFHLRSTAHLLTCSRRFSPEAKIEQVKIEQEIRRANSAGDKRDAAASAKAPANSPCSPVRISPVLGVAAARRRKNRAGECRTGDQESIFGWSKRVAVAQNQSPPAVYCSPAQLLSAILAGSQNRAGENRAGDQESPSRQSRNQTSHSRRLCRR